MSVTRNRYPGKCWECGEFTPVNTGYHDGQQLSCGPCVREHERQRLAAIAAEPKGQHSWRRRRY